DAGEGLERDLKAVDGGGEEGAIARWRADNPGIKELDNNSLLEPGASELIGGLGVDWRSNRFVGDGAPLVALEFAAISERDDVAGRGGGADARIGGQRGEHSMSGNLGLAGKGAQPIRWDLLRRVG